MKSKELISSEMISEDARKNYANATSVIKPVEKRQKELIEYFEKLIGNITLLILYIDDSFICRLD